MLRSVLCPVANIEIYSNEKFDKLKCFKSNRSNYFISPSLQSSHMYRSSCTSWNL